jgi:hypothetical protein
MQKDERIGFRVPANLKRAIAQIAKAEGRSLAQVCEIFLSAGIAEYKKRGPKFLKLFFQRPGGPESSE